MTSARIQAFSDGVFAFVITFLFFDIKLPADVEPTLSLLWREAPRLGIFVLTFWIVGTYWVAHHMILSFAKEVDRRLLYMNLLLLLAIVLMPLPAKMLAEHPTNLVAIGAYGTVLSIANLVGTSIWLRLTANSVGGAARRARLDIAFIHAAPIVVYAVGLGAATFTPNLGLALYACVPAFFSLPNPWLDNRTRRAFAALSSKRSNRGG
jgi:uncharacterized membrane protein